MSASAYRARVTIRLSPSVNDPQGNTVRAGLASLGHDDVRGVRVGKVIDLVLDARDAQQARDRVERMCHELLANPVIETYDIELDETS